MKYAEQHPMSMILVGILGISMSAIFVKYSTAPSPVTAAYRLCWTVLLMSPAVFLNPGVRKELLHIPAKDALLCCLSGILLAIHFSTWFESLHHTTVSASTVIVCTEVLWVALGYCIFLKGHLTGRALLAIAVTFAGSLMIAWSDSSGEGGHLYGDLLSLVAAIAVGGYTLIGRVMRSSLSTTVYTYIVYCCSAFTLILMTLGSGYSLWGYGSSGLVVGLCLAVFSTILGHSIFSWCLKYFSPAFVSASKLCEPVISGIFAALLFHEIPGPMQLAGSAVILAGVVYYSVLEASSAS